MMLISIGFLHPISLGPYKYSLAGFLIYTDDASRSGQNVYTLFFIRNLPQGLVLKVPYL